MKAFLTLCKRHKWLVFVLILSSVGLALRLLFLWKHSMAFTYDQGRDLLDIRAMVVQGKLSLIGPTTSLHGIFSGPFWYWLSLLFYLLTGGNPFSTELALLLISFVMPVLVYLSLSDKKLGLILAASYIFSFTFFNSSIVALNTNPMAFIMPLILVFFVNFFVTGKAKFLWLLMFLIGSSFHFEAIIGLFLVPFFLLSTLLFKKMKLVFKNSRALIAFFIPLAPLLIFDLRHNFIQTKTLLTLLAGKGSSLTPAQGGLTFRFYDRLDVFKNVFVNSAQNIILAAALIFLITFILIKIVKQWKNKKNEFNYMFSMIFVCAFITFIGFVLYPYALWPWYLGAVDALAVTLIGCCFYFLLGQNRFFSIIGLIFLLVFLWLNMSRYRPWPFEKVSSVDAANLRNRLAVVDLIYDDASGKGMKVFTFAPYVYDYPYQYLIWWRAKTRYNYLPEEYVYLTNQPAYVAAKEKADSLIEKRDSTCDYLIIEPFESQEKWFWDWRGRFPEAQKAWDIGKTKVEKLCQ